MDEKPEWAIKIKRTITLTQTLTSKSYPDMTLEEAIAYEKGLLEEEKIQAFVDNLSYATDDEFTLTDEVSEG